MAKSETIFSVVTWALMNVLVVSMAYETTIGSAPNGTSTQIGALATPPLPSV